jgi:predicted alpha/beta superfamily hydrolase
MRAHTIVGHVERLERVYSPQLNNRRDIQVYLPPSYQQGGGRYPVIYMHDGQNLFDEVSSFAGEWQVDETLERLSVQGIAAIVVGIPNMGGERINEYCPFKRCAQAEGRGDRYVAWIVETLKPLVDRTYRTLPERDHTGMMGSSMGGLITLHAYLRYPEVFGFAGIMSPSLWFGRRAIFPFVEAGRAAPRRLYLDVGTGEGGSMVADARRLRKLLVARGYDPQENLLYVEEEGAGHCEAAWAGRMEGALRFFLAQRSAGEQDLLEEAA